MRASDRESRPNQPAQRAFVAVLIVLSVMLAAAPLLAWPTIEIASSRSATISLGAEPLSVTVADTPFRRSFGLQGRSSLDDGEGMLFVFDPPSRQTFVRKSVPMAIEVVFLGPDGEVLAVMPLDASSPRAESVGRVAFAIELARGWCARHGVRPGDRAALPANVRPIARSSDGAY